ncbi:MAG: hypothetical protein HRU26_09250 [Psychroserpens sp.]|nr:hypothetical protein [Psychroserpens sp.]
MSDKNGKVSISVIVEKALKASTVEYTSGVVRELSKKYGFDASEALMGLNLNSVEVRVVDEKKGGRAGNRKTVQPGIPLPYTGVVKEDWCRGIRLNHGLMSQCTMGRVGEGEFCTTCQRQADKNVNGLPTYGHIVGREKDGWRTPGGKQPTNYGNVMEKLNITREKAISEAEKFGLTIPEEQFEKKAAQRGRPARKGVATSDTESEDGAPKPVKKRGRPKKDKKVISGSSGGGGDDLIATLMAQANVAVSDNLAPAHEEAKSDSKEEDEAAKKEAKRLERNAKAKAARDAKKAAAAAEAAAAAAAAAANAEAPTPVEQAAVAKAPAPVVQATVSVENDAEFKEIFQEPAVVPTKSVELSQSPVVSDSESEEEDDATSVRKFEFQGKTYLKDDDGCLYDLETQEHIGNFDDVNQCIDYCDEDEE